MRWRRRNMFYLTGLPGWIRFGFSPGWGGLPPTAQYLSQTGQLPQAIRWFQQQAPEPAFPSAWPTQQVIPASMGAPPAQMSRDQEIQMLESQAAALDDQLKQIRERMDQLKGQE